MSNPPNSRSRFRAALEAESPLQVAGTINAYCALLAQQAGFRAIYLSGAGVANASLGLPDLGVSTLNDVCEDVRRITAATDLPLLVDADTGWGGPMMIARTVRELIRAGASALHIEDQVADKRCGHRDGKVLVSAREMIDRLNACCDSRSDAGFVIMARTDAAGVEGLESAISRALQYVDAGADMIFVEALESVEEYRRFCQAVTAPVLANMTEFGRTPLMTTDELRSAGVRLVLYPLSAFRAMSAAARRVYEELRCEGTQEDLLSSMQTREELYEVLRYHEFEQQQDQLIRGKTNQ